MSPIEFLGWTANACFFSRFLIQWIASERAGRSVAPEVFWWLSIAGSVMYSIYSIYQEEPVLFVGSAINLCLFSRNVWMHRNGDSVRPLAGWIATSVACGLMLIAAVAIAKSTEWNEPPIWMLVVITGEIVWTSRFILQWCLSEHRGETHIPVAFWWVSLAGGALLLAYAIHIRNPVYMAGFLFSPLVQIRNLMIASTVRRLAEEAKSQPA